eukprot:TRINITY_DN5252_c0_g2_i1.p1 TRINITY_DN5252_c0_g2~~TRINITY_DN5252_c0_g2_i1.p1  ORF type:complete len:234 (-),score=35.05 TRINITY_DN5252_c0_g2_i1:238-864(-)
MASSPVLSQVQAVAGRATALNSSSSVLVCGRLSLVPAVSRRCVRRAAAPSRPSIVAMAPRKKVNAYDDAWTKSFFGTGYFAEDFEDADVPLMKRLEKKKLLSGVEKAGLLSTAEKLGFSLSKIEKLGLLSKAESLGVLSLIESLASVSPAYLASLSLPLVVGAIAVPILIPDDNAALLIGQYGVAAALGIAGLTSFAGSIVLGILQED